MTGSSRTCAGCQAVLEPAARFCGECGRPADPPRRPQPPQLPQLTQPPQLRPPRQPPRRHDRNRRGVSPVLWLVPLALIGAGAAAVLLLANPFGQTDGQRPASTGTGPAAAAGPASGTGTASPSQATERQAAASVAALLSRSAVDRTAVSAAAGDVADCGPRLTGTPAVFGAAANSREALLSSLAGLPGRAALPAALVSDLTRAWQASVAADQAYARWAEDEIAKGCVPRDTADPGYRASLAPDDEANAYKQDFTAQWAQVAAEYGLARYQPSQL